MELVRIQREAAVSLIVNRIKELRLRMADLGWSEALQDVIICSAGAAVGAAGLACVAGVATYAGIAVATSVSVAAAAGGVVGLVLAYGLNVRARAEINTDFRNKRAFVNNLVRTIQEQGADHDTDRISERGPGTVWREAHTLVLRDTDGLIGFGDIRIGVLAQSIVIEADLATVRTANQDLVVFKSAIVRDLMIGLDDLDFQTVAEDIASVCMGDPGTAIVALDREIREYGSGLFEQSTTPVIHLRRQSESARSARNMIDAMAGRRPDEDEYLDTALVCYRAGINPFCENDCIFGDLVRSEQLRRCYGVRYADLSDQEKHMNVVVKADNKLGYIEEIRNGFHVRLLKRYDALEDIPKRALLRTRDRRNQGDVPDKENGDEKVPFPSEALPINYNPTLEVSLGVCNSPRTPEGSLDGDPAGYPIGIAPLRFELENEWTSQLSREASSGLVECQLEHSRSSQPDSWKPVNACIYDDFCYLSSVADYGEPGSVTGVIAGDCALFTKNNLSRAHRHHMESCSALALVGSTVLLATGYTTYALLPPLAPAALLVHATCASQTMIDKQSNRAVEKLAVVVFKCSRFAQCSQRQGIPDLTPDGRFFVRRLKCASTSGECDEVRFGSFLLSYDNGTFTLRSPAIRLSTVGQGDASCSVFQTELERVVHCVLDDGPFRDFCRSLRAVSCIKDEFFHHMNWNWPDLTAFAYALRVSNTKDRTATLAIGNLSSTDEDALESLSEKAGDDSALSTASDREVIAAYRSRFGVLSGNVGAFGAIKEGNHVHCNGLPVWMLKDRERLGRVLILADGTLGRLEEARGKNGVCLVRPLETGDSIGFLGDNSVRGG